MDERVMCACGCPNGVHSYFPRPDTEAGHSLTIVGCPVHGWHDLVLVQKVDEDAG